MPFDFTPNYDVFQLDDLACHLILQRKNATEGAERTVSGRHSPASSESWDDFKAIADVISDELTADLRQILAELDPYDQPWVAVYRSSDHARFLRNCAVVGSRERLFAYSNRRVFDLTEYVESPYDLEDLRFQNFWLYQTEIGDYFLVWTLACENEQISTVYTVFLFDADDNIVVIGKGKVDAFVKKMSLQGTSIDFINNDGEPGSTKLNGTVI